MRLYARYLRIGWTVLCGIACVLLCVLWVRSYSIVEAANRISKSEMRTIIISDSGTISFGRSDLQRLESFLPPEAHGWSYQDYEPDPERIVSRFTFEWSATEFTIRAPYWCLALTTATLAVLPSIRWSNRFSLRTLLIAITLVAVVLGVVVWLVH